MLGTPYVNTSLLFSAPTGISWKLIPNPKSSPKEVEAEATNIAWRSTSLVDTYANQPLRSTINTEELSGPGNIRVGIQNGSGNGLLVMRRWPVTQVLAIQMSPNRSWPRQWTQVPSTQYEIEHPLINVATDTAAADGPDGGSSILLAPGIVDWRYGRNGWRVLSSYTNGWPHTSLTAVAPAGSTVLNVDDVTGWAGASGFVYDGGQTEPVAVQSVVAATPLPLPNGVGFAQAGPGTVTLTAPLAYQHTQGVLLTALPANVLWATVLAAMTQVLASGITAITIQALPGSEQSSGPRAEEFQMQYELLLEPFRRVV